MINVISSSSLSILTPSLTMLDHPSLTLSLSFPPFRQVVSIRYFIMYLKSTSRVLKKFNTTLNNAGSRSIKI